MNLSYNWLKDYLDISIEPTQLSEILTSIGLEVEGVKETKSGPNLNGVVVGKVLTCEQHPNADRLKVTTVDVGAESPLHIVCGAPNVAAGQKVFVATIGTELPTEEEKPFVIKKGKIRGETSEGMICAEDELGIGVSHDGIMVLEEEATIGEAAEIHLKFESDVVFEIGLTPNRSDATSVIGVADDIAAYLNFHKIKNVKVVRPNTGKFEQGRGKGIDVTIEDTDACPRYSGILVENVQVGPSPEWIVQRLESIGVRSINNVVDITNFVLHEFGQPLHAFDADKIKGDKIVVKKLAQNTVFQTLDNVDRKLNENDLMICDEENGLCIAGVFGGSKSGVTDTTTRIFLESAHFEASSLRQTSFRHLLRSDAAMVYEKGSDPNITLEALKRAVLLLKEYAGAEVASEIVDIYPKVILPVEIVVSAEKIQKLSGLEISQDVIAQILGAMKMELTHINSDKFKVKVPTNKSDVTREIDILEEILRIYGFDKVPLPGYIHAAIPQSEGIDSFSIKNKLSNILTGLGLSETMALSLVDGQYITEIADTVAINNTSNRSLNIMRPHMAYSALETVNHNLNRQQNHLKFFEFGSVYETASKDYAETRSLSIYMTGPKFQESWTHEEKRNFDFFDIKANVQMVLDKMGIVGFQVDQFEDDFFDYGLKYFRGPKDLVSFGKISTKLAESYGVKKDVFLAVFNWDNLLDFYSKRSLSYSEITKFPRMRRDLAVVVNSDVTMNDIVRLASKADKTLIQDINLFDVYESEEHLGEGKKSYAISYQFEHKDRTLNDKEVTKVMSKLIGLYEKQLGALIRK